MLNTLKFHHKRDKVFQCSVWPRCQLSVPLILCTWCETPALLGKVCLSFPRTQESLWDLLNPVPHPVAALSWPHLAWTFSPPADVFDVSLAGSISRARDMTFT